jgi:hypothetical protein
MMEVTITANTKLKDEFPQMSKPVIISHVAAATATATATTTATASMDNSSPHRIIPIMTQLVGFVISCSVVSFVLITWEDAICRNVLSSRQHRVEILRVISSTRNDGEEKNDHDDPMFPNTEQPLPEPISIPTIPRTPSSPIITTAWRKQQSPTPSLTTTREDYYRQNYNNDNNLPWGMSTIRGMGYGIEERTLLISSNNNDNKNNGEVESKSISLSNNDDNDNDVTSYRSSNSIDSSLLLSLPSYNEVMQHHRDVTIPQWKQQQKQIPSHQNVADAIHDIVQSYHVIHDMQSITNHYQWDTIRHMIHQKPMTDISISS